MKLKMKEIKHITDLYKQKRYEVISDTMIKVDNHTVKKQIKKGRQILICSCENDSQFGNINLCRHKLFYLYLPLLELWEQELDKLITFYIGARNNYSNEETKKIAGFFCSDLEELKRL